VFSSANLTAFHAPDGWGYGFLADLIAEIDPLNAALSARLATGFESWRKFDAPRRAKAHETLRRLSERSLSKNAVDILERALAP